MLTYILEGLGAILSVQNFLIMNLGVMAGLIFGSIPGLTVLMCIVLLLPLTFGMEPTTGMSLLLGAYCGGTFGGSITAIMINTPGTPAAAATLADGYGLTKKGKSHKALNMALYASVIAGLISTVVLLGVAPLVAKVAIEFGPAEFFALAMFGITVIISVSSNNLLKGLISGFAGIYLSTIGFDPILGIPRLTFGNYNLMSGINLVPALVGAFSISELLNIVEGLRAEKEASNFEAPEKTKEDKLTLKELKECTKTILKSSFIGTFIGAIPGTGAILASFLSYNEAKRSSKKPEEFGHGSLEGVAASEAGNNGITGATLIPMMTLGIPGDVVTAVMMGALIMHGLPVGPTLFVEHSGVAYGVILSLFFINIIMFFQAKIYVKYFVKVCDINRKLFTAILLCFCVIGSFAVNSSMFDVFVMLTFGIVGYLMLKFNFPLIPMVLALVLGPLAEKSFRQALVISNNSYAIFIQKPISAIFLTISLISVVATLYNQYKINHQKRPGVQLKENSVNAKA